MSTLFALCTQFLPLSASSPLASPHSHTHTLSLSFFFLSSELSHSPPSLFILALISLFTLFPLPSSYTSPIPLPHSRSAHIYTHTTFATAIVLFHNPQHTNTYHPPK